VSENNGNQSPPMTTEQLADKFQELSILKDAIHKNIGLACEEVAVVMGRPVDPDLLAGVILQEVGVIAILWGRAQQSFRPEFVEDYFEQILRRAKRGFRVQIMQALNPPPTSPEGTKPQ
jgi:hypothetical protein